MFEKPIELNDMPFRVQGPVTSRMTDDISIVPPSKEQPSRLLYRYIE
jgi:hypothetical protein